MISKKKKKQKGGACCLYELVYLSAGYAKHQTRLVVSISLSIYLQGMLSIKLAFTTFMRVLPFLLFKISGIRYLR